MAGFQQGAVVGSCAGRGHELPCASHSWAQPPLELVTATHGVPKLQPGRLACSTPAPTYLWKNLQPPGWGICSWRQMAGGTWLRRQLQMCCWRCCGENTARGSLWRKVSMPKGVIHRGLQPTGKRCQRGETLRDYCLWAPHTREGHLWGNEPYRWPIPGRGTKNEGKQRKTSKKCETETIMYLTPTASAAHPLTKGTRRDWA